MTTIHPGLDVNLGGVASGSADQTKAVQGQSAQVQPQVQPGSGDQAGEVKITSTAQLMAALEKQISSTPDVNQGRVDAIRQALGNGSYQVSAGRIADGVLAAQKFHARAGAGSGPAD